MSSRVGSVSFVRNRPAGDDIYRASKAALNAITRSFQVRMKDQSITVLSVSPGLVKTDLTGGRGEIDVATACKGVVDLVLKAAGTQKHGYFRYDGEELPW
jgi:NAD(P)-dependent dehydrogenase (short-subunit alcohol dehydrogenase family)